MRKEAVAALIAILVVASLGIGYLSGNDTRATQTMTSVSTSTVTTTTTTSISTETSVLTQGILVPVSSASTLNPVTGLSLNLNLSTNEGRLIMTVYEFNTLDRINNVSFGSNWPDNTSLFQWTPTNCYDPGMEGYEVLQGNYGSNNYTDGQALWLQPQNNQMQCGVETETMGNSSYIFQPLSTRDILSGMYIGYWIGGGTYTPFAAGTYTMLAGDQWGQVAILHFLVAG